MAMFRFLIAGLELWLSPILLLAYFLSKAPPINKAIG